MVSCLSIFWRFSSDWRTRHGNVCSPWCNQSDSCPMSALTTVTALTWARWVTALYYSPVSDSPLLAPGEWQPLTVVRWVTAPYCSAVSDSPLLQLVQQRHSPVAHWDSNTENIQKNAYLLWHRQDDAHFQGNPLLQATTRHLNSETVQKTTLK